MKIDIEKLYKDLTGLEIGIDIFPGDSSDVTLSELYGFEIPAGTKATYRPADSPYDMLIEYGDNSLGVRSDGHFNIDVVKGAPENSRELIRDVLENYPLNTIGIKDNPVEAGSGFPKAAQVCKA